MRRVAEGDAPEGDGAAGRPTGRSRVALAALGVRGGDELLDAPVLAHGLHGGVVGALEQLDLGREAEDQLVEDHGPGGISGGGLRAHDDGQGASGEEEVHQHVEHAGQVPRGDERPLHVDALHRRLLDVPVEVRLPPHGLDGHAAVELLAGLVHQHHRPLLADRQDLLEGPGLREVRVAEENRREGDEGQQRRHRVQNRSQAHEVLGRRREEQGDCAKAYGVDRDDSQHILRLPAAPEVGHREVHQLPVNVAAD
mmetsp:Transcript_108278/g.337433  ORF Transcript_108278/g.337433 Transcript_108278/m.337433 type:complete len:254 (+) Transcript_108278:911-1672(+)